MNYQPNCSTSMSEHRNKEPHYQTSRTMKNKICTQCCKEFLPNSGRAVYCSISCKKEYYQNLRVKSERTLDCPHCSINFIPTNSTQKFCSAECRITWTAASKSRPIKYCEHCNKDISHKIAVARFCNMRCYGAFRQNNKHVGIESQDYIICPVCNMKVKQITPKHAKMHGYDSAKQMQISLNMKLITCESKKQKSQGENNPGYQHGGKLSAWSTKFSKGYDSERHKEKNKNQSDFVKQNPQLFKNRMEYWITEANGDKLLAKQLQLKFQLRDLNYFVEKYGEVEGKKRHTQKIQRWKGTLQSKPIAEQIEINRRKVKKAGCFYSKAEKELFDNLRTVYPLLEDQFALCRDANIDNKKFFLYDMRLNNKIIEYNGDFWHANPEIYNESFVNPYTHKTQIEIHEREKEKINLAISNGFDVLVVWENKYKTNKQAVIQQCIDFLEGNHNVI